MAMSTSDPLQRAVEAARSEEPEHWATVSDSVKRRVRATVLPSRPIVVVTPDGTTEQDALGSRTYVASRVVRGRVREVLASRDDLTAERIDLTVDDDDRLVRVEVDLVCSYGTVLPVAVAQTRGLVDAVVAELLGEGTRPPIDVRVTDVVVGDPRRT